LLDTALNAIKERLSDQRMADVHFRDFPDARD
jgi:hypothetical protein